MVQEGVNGCLVAPGDPRGLGAALESLVDSNLTRRRMGLASRRLAEQEHDADANNRQIIQLMVALAAARARALQTA
jgi:glycosyltransferase involved in cell wall biosynthesis